MYVCVKYHHETHCLVNKMLVTFQGRRTIAKNSWYSIIYLIKSVTAANYMQKHRMDEIINMRK